MSNDSDDLSLRETRLVELLLGSTNVPTNRELADALGLSSRGVEIMRSRPRVRAELESRKRQRERRTGIDAAVVLETLAELLHADIGDAYDDDGNVRPLREMSRELRRRITSYEVDDRGRIKLRWIPTDRLIELVGRHVSVQSWRHVVHHDAGDRLIAAIERGHARVAAEAVLGTAEKVGSDIRALYRKPAPTAG